MSVSFGRTAARSILVGGALLLTVPQLPAQSSRKATVAPATCAVGKAHAGTRVLVFSRTAGFRHASIPNGIAAIRELGAKHGFAVEATEDPKLFADSSLRRFSAVVFMSTTGDVLDSTQQVAFEKYIRRGGGFAGVHSATDTEYDWPWYGRLVGAYFRSHPANQQATLQVVNRKHISTKCLAPTWSRVDEWYDFKAPPAKGVNILITLDESTYKNGRMGSFHPVAWYHRFDGGRSWYTELGHTVESYKEVAFLNHLAGGILWAAAR